MERRPRPGDRVARGRVSDCLLSIISSRGTQNNTYQGVGIIDRLYFLRKDGEG